MGKTPKIRKKGNTLTTLRPSSNVICQTFKTLRNESAGRFVVFDSYVTEEPAWFIDTHGMCLDIL